MRTWRTATWGVVLWAVLFPIAWLALLMTSSGDNGERLRLLDIAFGAIVGAVLWAASTGIGLIIWLLVRRFEDRNGGRA
jgi:hypothetical protein